jgi:hypothetical protein
MDIQIIPLNKEFEIFTDLYPPVLSNKIQPEWYKKAKIHSTDHWLYEVDPKQFPAASAKSCPAIQDTVVEGITIPLWGKLRMYTEQLEDGNYVQKWDFTGRKALDLPLSPNFIGFHTKEQTEDMPLGLNKDNMLLKIQMPYKIIVPEGYNIYYTDPYYHFRDDIRCMSGIVQADKWGMVTFPFSIENENFVMEAGTPLVQCFIYKRNEDKINLTVRNGTSEEYKQIDKQTRELFLTEQTYRNK